jgi:hypothetical protein
MTRRYIYIGSLGPFIYDDEDTITDDEYGYADGEPYKGFQTDGAINTTANPTDPNDMFRLQDVGIQNVESFSDSGTITSTKTTVLVTGDGYDLFLPTISTGTNRSYEIKNVGVGSITLKPNVEDVSALIEGEPSQPLEAGYSISVFCSGTAWWIK